MGILFNRNKINKKLVIIEVTVAAVICFGLFAFILFAHSNSMLDHVTGLTLKQEGETIVAKWDKMKCKGYNITVLIDERRAGKTHTQKNYYVLRNVKYNHEYQFKVEARMRQGTTSVAAEETIFTLQPQDIQMTDHVEEGLVGQRLRCADTAINRIVLCGIGGDPVHRVCSISVMMMSALGTIG